MARVQSCAAAALFLLTATAAFPHQSTLPNKTLAKERQGLDCLKIGNLADFAALTIEDVNFVQLSSQTGLIAIRPRNPARLTENNSRQRPMSRLFGWTAKVSGSAYSVRILPPANLEV